MADYYKDKWYAYLRERWGARVPVLTPANNPDPICRKCWDKGYASYWRVTSGYADFPGDRGYTRTEITKVFCQYCARGRSAEVADAYERGTRAISKEIK